jgi:hypothetical protein
VDRAQAEYLEQLVKHPGWLLFKEYARKQWGPEGYGRRMKEAIAVKDSAVVAVNGVDYAATEINALMSWPEDQVKHAAPVKPPEFSLQRGGA